jgi:Ca2+/H+ antiporter
MAPAGVFHHFFTPYYIGAFEPHHLAGGQAEVLFGRVLHKIVRLDVEFAAERNVAAPGVGVFGIVFAVQHLFLPFRVVGQHDLYWVKHHHAAQGNLVEVFADAELQQPHVDQVFAFGHAHPFAEVADAFGRVTPPAHAADGRHARIVPAAHVLLVHQLQQFALAHYRVGHVEAGKLELVRRKISSSRMNQS